MKTDSLWKFSFPLFLLLSVSLLFIVYASTLDNPFFFDDKSVIINNPYIKSLIHIREFFADHNPYFLAHRGINILSLALNYQFGGMEPFSYHLTNILLHLGVALLFFTLCKSLLKVTFSQRDEKQLFLVASAVSLLFLLHPVHTASVSYIAKRDGILVGFFLLISLLSYHRFRVVLHARRYIWLLVSFLSFFVAFWSKETAAITPLLILLYELIFYERSKREWLIFLSIIGVIGTIFLIYLLFFFQGGGLLHYSPGEAFGAKHSTWPVSLNIATQSVVIVHYLSLLLLPLPSRLSIDQDFFVYLSFFNSETVLSFCFHGLVLLGFLFLFRKGWKLSLFGILWFYIALMPESSFIPLKEVMVDYRTYVPSLGLMFIVAEIFIRLNCFKEKRGVLALCIILLTFTVITKERNILFDSRATIWKDAAEKAPGKLRPTYNYANALLVEKRTDEAIDAFHKALLIDPSYPSSLVGLAQLYLRKRDIEKASSYAKQASEAIEKKVETTVEERDLLAASYYVQAVYFAQKNKLKKAHHFGLKAVETSPSTPGYILLTKLYLSSHQIPQALFSLQRAKMFDTKKNNPEIVSLQQDIVKMQQRSR